MERKLWLEIKKMSTLINLKMDIGFKRRILLVNSRSEGKAVSLVLKRSPGEE